MFLIIDKAVNLTFFLVIQRSLITICDKYTNIANSNWTEHNGSELKPERVGEPVYCSVHFYAPRLHFINKRRRGKYTRGKYIYSALTNLVMKCRGTSYNSAGIDIII
jgi:hypothetical protein